MLPFLAAATGRAQAPAPTCPPNDWSYLGLQVGGYADNTPPGQKANLSFLARYTAPMQGTRVFRVVARRYCVWPDVAGQIEAALRNQTEWSSQRHSGPWYQLQAMSITWSAGMATIGFADANTNGEPAGDDAYAGEDLGVNLSAAEALALANEIAAWRANISCRPLAKFPQ